MTITPEIMQAAERLRRVAAGEDPVDVYGYRERPKYWGRESTWDHEAAARAGGKVAADKLTLADFALSILPKGDMPRALETPEHNQRVWYFDLCGDAVHESHIKVRKNMPYVLVYDSEDYWDTITSGGTQVFATEEIAKLAVHWQKLQDLMAVT